MSRPLVMRRADSASRLSGRAALCDLRRLARGRGFYAEDDTVGERPRGRVTRVPLGSASRARNGEVYPRR